MEILNWRTLPCVKFSWSSLDSCKMNQFQWQYWWTAASVWKGWRPDLIFREILATYQPSKMKQFHRQSVCKKCQVVRFFRHQALAKWIYDNFGDKLRPPFDDCELVDVKFHWFFATFSKKDTNTTEFNTDTSGVFYILKTTLPYLKIVLHTSKYLIFVLVKTLISATCTSKILLPLTK